MSIEKPLREMVQAELRSRLGPMHKAITRMDERLDVIEKLVDVVQRLAPLATRMQSLQLSLPGMNLPVERGGRGRGVAAPVPPVRARSAEVVPAPRGRPGLAQVAREAEREAAREEEGRRCAVIGCKRPARSKGYCSAHYQKLRLLVKTNRRPEQWVDDAGPQSVPDVVLPRGRAASKAREEVPPQSPEPQEPPKPKAWVRKKGGQERISLH